MTSTELALESKYHIPADSVSWDDRTQVINHYDTFGIFDRWGDIHPHGRNAQGIFHGEIGRG